MKTYNEIDIKYYDNDGNIQVRCSAPVTQDALVHYELMQSHYCKLSFKLSKPIYFLLGDFIDTPYGRFELIDLTKAKDNDTIGYSYEILFDAYYRKFKNKILKYRPNTGSQEATFSLTSTISTHVEVIMKSLAYYAKLDKSYLYDPKFEGEGTDYTYVIDASVDANAAKLITYSNTSVLDAIANIAQTFECEWWFEGNILHFGTCENTNAIVDFRLNDNIVSMSSSQSQSTYANRVYAFGAARNLPSGYKNDADADITKDGVVEKRLMLPTSAECSDKNKQLLAENGFELKNGYIQVGGLHEDQYVEGVTTNDDIYPRNLIKTSNVTSYEKDVEDESTPEEGDYIKRTFYRVNSLTIVNDDGEKTGDMAFRKAYILSGKNLHIVFQSGSLNGMDFECEFNPDGVSEILKDDDGNPILKDGKEQINPKSQVFEIVANEDYGRFLPDTTLHPKDGDTFVLYNWDSTKLGDALVSAASNELLTDSIKNLKKSIIDPTTYTCTAEANYSFNQGRGNLHGVGDRVNLYNKGYDDSYRSSRVIGYEFSLDIPFDGAKYYVGEKPSYSRLNAMESKIEELVYNGQSYLNGNGGSGRSIYIIKSYDSITPTDYNVFSAKAVDEQRLNKTKDDTVKGTITWEKVQKFFSGLHVGNSNNENGGSWTPDAEGRSHLITDYLEVRMKAIFEELVINKTSTIGGKEIISPAGGVVAHKVEEVTVTYNNVSQKAYRCYFLAEQEGDAVDNDFAVGDQVRSESFNVRKGTYHKDGNHFYWRLVIGRDEDPVELEGKKYHYIDLSDTDCATASDVPAKGDVLNQCGNRTDVERQNCLIFSAVDTYSPSISLYHGINSYSFANREYVEYGVNKQNNKAFFNVYGDMYVGDRPTKENGYEGSSYIRYDSSTKQLSVKGKISAKSTVDGKELSQYFNKIAELQNQVDGAIETWFYDGVPTLENAPAISWKTDKDKEIHLGDLYYNNKTGKAYRFAKDSNTYKWTIITDTDIAKALSDARMAQETANGKMKVFSVQPTTPYQVGDIWVNATYPSDGSTYKNEVLRCQTNKAAGSQFAIGDWIKASKYTDDTVANAAKKAAEDAQKAAQTAQTDIKNLGNTVTDNKKEFDNYVTDGYLEPSEIAAMAQDSKRLEDDFAAAQKSYNEVKDAEVLKDTKELTDLNTAFATLTSAKTELIKFLSDISKRYNETDTDGKAAIVSAVGMKFTNFQSAYSAFYDKLGLANAYITSKIYGDLKQNITDLAGYKYLKDALGQTTDIDGGLVMTTLLALRDGDGNVQSGINGAIDPNRGKKSIATWWGGQMVDKDYNSGNLTPATSLIRFDGSGYLANGAIWWDVSGKVHADPTSFIISEKNLGAYLIFFEPTWKEGSAGTSVADLVSLKPNAPFSKLGVSGDATFEGAISFHGIKLTYDSTNKAIKIDGNLYTTGGITAYGAGASTTGGGGLIASVISYARILEGSYTDADLTSIPNAYAIKALSSRIDNIATELGGLNLSWNNITGKPSTFAPSAHTHKWTEITDRITKVSQLTNDAGYLTAHQSLASYYTKAEIDAKGYTTNKGTVTSVALTLPTGLACATKTITTSGTFAVTFASGYSIPTTTKQTAWDGAVSAKHTHSNKSVLDGISSTKVSHWNSAYDWYALMTTDEETADGIINKWNEVVSFLANIAQTDTLSGIVDGINKSISDEVTRAKKAEGVNASGISTNKTSITTLQGYFTSGSAKKALQLTNTHKLWGNSFNGTADINGSIIVPDGKYISIGNIKMEYDATNKALKITNTTTNEVANLYTSGGVSAYGVGTSSSSGGGLNGSVKSYSNALKLTSESLSEIASAYSIKALDSRISSLEGGSAMNVSVSGSGNAVTAISKSGTTIIVTKGTTFLTSHQSLASYLTRTDAASLYQPKGNYLTAHQSLDGYVNAITTSGSGNAITSVSKSGKGITFTKGATFLTSHQSLANYYTKSSVDSLLSGKSATSHTHSVKINGVTKTIAASGGTAVDLGTYLTSHQSLANYVTINDSRLSDSRYPKFANYTWYLVGDDAYIGDHNIGGTFCIKSANNVNVSGIAIYNSDETKAAKLWFDNTNINLDKQLVMNNKRIWIQGVGTAGGNNNRLTLVAGMPSGLAYNTSCRGTILYSNGIAFADPYNGNSNNDSGWIRHLETSANSGTLEIAVGDDASNEQIHFRWYNTNSSAETIAHDITVPRATGTLALTSQIPTTLPANGGNADKLDGYHANGLLTALSNSNNGISITVGGTTKSVSNISANHASNADTALKVYGQVADTGSHELVRCDMNNDQFRIIAGSSGLNNGWAEIAIADDGNEPIYVRQYSGVFSSVVRTLTLLDVNGHTHFPSYINIGGNENNNSSPDRVWGSNGSDSYLRSYRTSALNVNYAASAGNADTVDGKHLIKNGSGTGIKQVYYFNVQGNNTSYIKLGTLKTVSATGYSTSKVMFTVKGGINYGGTNESVYEVAASTRGSIQVTSTLVRGNRELKFGYVSTSSNVEIWIACDVTYRGVTEVEVSSSVNFTLTMTETTTKPSGFVEGSYRILAATADNVASATKLQTPRTIWGQSFDGTGNVNGTIYINNSDSENGAIILNNNVNTHARISAIKDQVVFNTGAAIRFGATNWEYSDWAGLKYDTVANAIYLGIADGTVFNYYSNKRSNGTLKFPGITTITPDSGARIGGSGGDLYLGNANNSNWVKVQNICSHNGSNYWYIYQSGNAHFSNINVVGNANIGGDTTIGGNCLAKGGVTAYQSSDIRLKQDLRKLDYLGIIKAMGGTFGFAWKKDNTRSIGWIAQHVLCNPHLKDIVETDEKGYYKINYWSPKLIATAFGAIEQVGDEVSRLKARVVFLESEVQRLSGDKEDCNKKRLDNKNINSLN